uniref:Uncharacterized protein n=1 Tax=Dendroctonus ponderosae TaxID=77166 RepID=A0AAR5QE80_DENPD
MLAFYLGLPRQSEVLLIVFLGICFLSLDFSLFHLKSNVEDIWKLELNKTKYLELFLKYVISAIVVVRTFTLHIFLAFYVIMLWPAIFEEKPHLMLPWLLLGIIRCLILNALTFVLGTFICHKEKGLNSICLDYIIAQVIEHGPSVYAWFSILSFYREILMECELHEPSVESLCSKAVASKNSQGPEEVLVSKAKSYSLSDLSLDCMQSSDVGSFPADRSMEILKAELRDLFEKKRVLKDSSKSFDSLIHANLNKSTPSSFSAANLSIIEQSMRALEISDHDVERAQQLKGQFLHALKEVSLSDVYTNTLLTRSFYISQGKLYKGLHMPKSHSQADDGRSEETCLCFIRKQLQLRQSNQTLHESEIATVTLNDMENEKQSDLNCLNGVRMEVGLGARLGFSPQRFGLKKTISKNFGCQVGLLQNTRDQLVKKIFGFRLSP